MKLGKFTVDVISDGEYKLDGGAMFGIVPKVLWGQTTHVDERNRIPLALNCVLIRTGSENILVETGIGRNYDSKIADIYAIKKSNGLLSSLKELEVKPEEINWVILTHLHFDHSGGISHKGILNYPNAKHVIQEEEWKQALNPHVRFKGSYFTENYELLKDSKNLYLIKGGAEIVPGVKVIFTGGHTHGHQMVLVESEGKKLAYWGDLIPFSPYVRNLWTCGFDFNPEESISKKDELLRRAFEEQWIMVMPHEREIKFGRLVKEKEKYKLVQYESLLEQIVER